MRKILLFFLVAIIFSGCEKFNPDSIPEGKPEGGTEKFSDLVVRLDNGFHSDLPELVIKKGETTKFSVISKSGKEIESATWKIGAKSFKEKEITYTASNLGESKGEIVVTFSDKKSSKLEFILVGVADLAEKDPVRGFILSREGTKAELLFLFSRSRLANLDKNNLMCIGGFSKWEKIAIPLEDYHYAIKDGKPEKLSAGGDYVGVKITLSQGWQEKIAIIHSGGIWADLSGSVFATLAEPTLAVFKLNGLIVPLGK